VTETVAAVVPAAGLGTRLADSEAGTAPKAVRLLGGSTLLRRSASTLAAMVDLLVVAGPPDHLDDVRRDVHDLGCPVEVVAGGATRQESVRLALAAVPEEIELVLVHDAARPLVPSTTIERVLEALRGGATAVVPVVPVADTLRGLDESGANGPLDRSRVRAVQTPQGFRRDVLVAAHAQAADDDATDDAGLVELLGYQVTLVEGDPLAFKITRPLDLLLAESLLRQQR
jgi:2-C-methyl-D-erythritol 4-phosphate cytidylyltransferase